MGCEDRKRKHIMNRTCLGDFFSVNGRFYYRCMYDSSIVKNVSKNMKICPHCERPCQPTFRGEVDVVRKVFLYAFADEP